MSKFYDFYSWKTLLIENETKLNNNFYNWFSNSKIVNHDGTPLVVYHGTNNKNIKIFNLDFVGSSTDSGMFGKGFYFTDNINYASTYNRDKTNGGILSCYLSIQNPLIINSKSDIPNINVPNETIEDMISADTNYSKIFREFLITNNFDGVIDNIGSIKQFVALYPNQIKSVNNVGSWNSNNNDIYS